MNAAIPADTPCRTNIEGSWSPATVRHLNADGTYVVELDIKQISFMKYWHGVTRAEIVVDEDAPGAGLFKLYWNQTRMGGRDPGEVARPVTLEDTIAALGLDASAVADKSVAAIAAFEKKNQVKIPENFARIFSMPDAVEKISASHPNSPEPLSPKKWRYREGLRKSHNLKGDRALVFMEPHQGEFVWAIVFDDGDQDGRVYVTDESATPSYHPSAESSVFYFWDIAQTGLGWWQRTQPGEKVIAATDIGLKIG